MTRRGRVPRALICEGCSSYAEILRRALAHHDEIEVVGVFTSFARMLAAIAESGADLVVLDVDQIGPDSTIAVSRAIRRLTVPLLVLSGDTSLTAERTAAALAAGALEALSKHRLSLVDPDGPDAAMLRRTARRVAASAVEVAAPARGRPDRVARADEARRRAPRPRNASVVGICASTGGPGILEEVLGALPADYPLPILVVQHISSGFMDGLIKLLNTRIELAVAVARDGAVATAGVWFAPDDAHLTVDRDLRLALDSRTVAGPHRPSGDLLLSSLAEGAACRAVGVILTGMGRDGSRGGAALRAAGGLLLAQDPETATAYGMPRAAVQAGGEALTVAQIAVTLRDLARLPA